MTKCDKMIGETCKDNNIPFESQITPDVDTLLNIPVLTHIMPNVYTLTEDAGQFVKRNRHVKRNMVCKSECSSLGLDVSPSAPVVDPEDVTAHTAETTKVASSHSADGTLNEPEDAIA